MDSDARSDILTMTTPMVANESDSWPPQEDGKRIFRNFCVMAVLFSANHGTIVSCLSLATARLGGIGALQSGVLYLCYTLSSVLGSTYVVKEVGSRNGMIVGMILYCAYVGCFSVATSFPLLTTSAALIGAMLGGIGAGFLWVAQGAYFTEASKRHAAAMDQELSESTSAFAGSFAFTYLLFEVLLRALSTLLSSVFDWTVVFLLYTTIAVISTFGMLLVTRYPTNADTVSSPTLVFSQVTSAIQLLATDPKMKYMIGLNTTFGFAGAFLNSYVNGQVLASSLDDPNSHYVGVFTSWMASVAAVGSLLTMRIPQKGVLLVLGSICFFFVAFPFLLQPDATQWGWKGLVAIYTLQGIGRATFESTLKATFAEFFSSDAVGAFSNMILQNGLAGSLGYILTFHLQCDTPSRYCVMYTDGTLHNVMLFVLVICVSAVVAIIGYWRASALFHLEQNGNRHVLIPSNEVVEA